MYFSNALTFLISTFFNLYIAAVLIRVILQFVRAPFNNEVAQFIVRITDPGVKIFRRFIPGFFGIDFASLTYAYLLVILKLMLINVISLHILMPSVTFIFTYIIFAVFDLLSIILSIYFWSIIIMVVLSMLAQGYQLYGNPIYTMVYMIAEPVLKPIRKTIPPIAGFDLSPLFACLLITVLRILFNL